MECHLNNLDTYPLSLLYRAAVHYDEQPPPIYYAHGTFLRVDTQNRATWQVLFQ
jgi:hypothetical protein